MKVPVARPIEDVIDDLKKYMVRMLPGSQAVQASWAMLGLGEELIASGEHAFRRHDADVEAHRLSGSTDKFATSTFTWMKHGEYYAGQQMIRKLADAFRVPNVTWREVPDVEAAEAVGSADSGSGEVRD